MARELILSLSGPGRLTIGVVKYGYEHAVPGAASGEVYLIWGFFARNPRNRQILDDCAHKGYLFN